jgi:hypothetical protein
MRQLLLLILSGLCVEFTYAQHGYATDTHRHATAHAIQNIDRYGYDYFLPGYVFNGDSSILETIDLESLECFRLMDQSVTIEDKSTGLQITLIGTKLIGRVDHDGLNPDSE